MADSVEPDQVVDADVVVDTKASELVVRHDVPGATVAPQASAGDLIKRLDTIKEAMERAMVKDVDYGVIPGTAKPTLLKPGAEKLMVLFQLDLQPTFRNEYGPGDHLTVECEVTAFFAPNGSRLGKGIGICSTREKRYAKRRSELLCPTCGKANVRRSKKRPGESGEPGWYCWAKTDGCGGNFAHDDQRITSQTPGEVDNPDLPDTWNTIAKIAEKRAKVDCVLAVTGASALFTQDLEGKPQEEKDAGAQASSGEPEVAPAPPERKVLSPRGVQRFRSLIEGAGLDVAEVVKEARVASGKLEDVDADAAGTIEAIVATRVQERIDAEREASVEA